MKKLVLLLMVIVFASCSNEKPKDPNTAVFIEERLKDFIAGNADWNVEPTQAEITEKFKHQVINWSNEPDFLKNMPLQLKSISDTLINEQTYKIAVFKTAAVKTSSEDALLKHIDLQINGILSTKETSTLAIGKNYTLIGTLNKQGKRADIRFIHTSNSDAYDLGKYTFSLTSFKQL